MRTAIALLLLIVSAQAEFTDDLYPVSADILVRLVAAAQAKGEPFASRTYQDNGRSYAYYLSSTRYVGLCRTPFGIIHIAALDFTRSGAKASTQPARMHSFVIFFDENLGVRGTWNTDPDFSRQLSVRDTSKLFYGNTLALDFLHLPVAKQLPGESQAAPHVVVGGDLFTVPTW